MERAIQKVINQVKPEDEDHLDVLYWRSKSLQERLAEVVRLRKNYYNWLNNSFPAKIEMIISQRKQDV